MIGGLLGLIGEFDQGVELIALAVLCVLGAWPCWVVVQYLRHRRSGRQRELELLSESLPPDERLPHVLVQIPTFNEGNLIDRVARAVGALDWPRERLHIQVLDDSTDGNVVIARQATGGLQALGLDAVLLHRTERTGFKAGALQQGLLISNHDYVAIFDADFVPAPDFLRQCLKPLLRDPGLAFVQARWEFLNGDENTLTQVQRYNFDTNFGVTVPAINRSGAIMVFSGTCGVWRRTAIENAGGWQSDTLVEDVDLSYRAYLKGWRGLMLVTVAVPGELPSDLKVWQIQQFRWTKGWAQVARKHILPIWRAPMPMTRKLVNTVSLSNCLLGPLLNVAIVAGVIQLLLGRAPTWPEAMLAAFAIVQGIGWGAALLILGQCEIRGADVRSAARQVPTVIALYALVAARNMMAVTDVLRNKVTEFVRTPKKGSGSMPRGNSLSALFPGGESDGD